MATRVCIVSAEFPPRRGGVADHTAILAATLAAKFEVNIVTSAGAEHSSPARIQPAILDWRDPIQLVLTLAPFSPRATLLWQYAPPTYGRGGVNPVVPGVIEAFRGRGGRQIVIAHQIDAAPSLWPHRFYYRWALLRQWRKILRAADIVGVASEAWLEHWRQSCPAEAAKLHLLHSPATLPVRSVEAEHRLQWRRQQGLPESAKILVHFGIHRSPRLAAWIRSAWRAAQSASNTPVALVQFGGGPPPRASALIGNLRRDLGYLEAKEASAVLQAADCLALPFPDGVSERRTTFMAGLAHGCATVTTLGPATGPTLRHCEGFVAADCRNRTQFEQLVVELLTDGAKRAKLAQQGRERYTQRYGWAQVADKLGEWIEGVS